MKKWVVQKAYREWLQAEFEPVTMITLTFREDVSAEKAWGLFKKWVHEINHHVIGKHYKRKYKHSYFGYIVTAERQARGTIHYHLVVDNYIPYKFSSSVWWRIGGFIKIKKVTDAPGSIRYLLKYLTKTDIDPVIWRVKKKYVHPETIDINEVVQEYLDRVPGGNNE